MTKYLTLAALLAAFAWSCKNDASAPLAAEAPAAADSTAIEYNLFCVDIGRPEDKRPHHDVYAVVGKDTLMVGTIEACGEIAREDYAQYEIPEDAFDALGGTSNDKTTYIVYLAKSPEGKIQARIGDMYPGKQGGFTYRTWVVLTDEDINPGASLSPADLVGSYVLSGADKSYVLFLGVSNRTLMGQAFVIKGPLPGEDAQIMEAISKGSTPEVIPNIQLNLDNHEFSCAKGPGKFNVAGNKVQSVTFLEWGGKGITLEKKEIGTAYVQ